MDRAWFVCCTVFDLEHQQDAVEPPIPRLVNALRGPRLAHANMERRSCLPSALFQGAKKATGELVSRSCFLSEVSRLQRASLLHLLARRSDSERAQQRPFGVRFRVLVLVPGAGECILQADGVKSGLCVCLCGRVSMLLYSISHTLS